MKGVSPGAKLLYGQLSRHAGKDGNAYPSYKTLARAIGLKERQAMRLAHELSDAKLIEIRKRTDGVGRQRSNAFVFLWHEAFEPRAPEVKLEGEIVDPRGDEPDRGEGDTSDTPQGDGSDTHKRVTSEESHIEEKHTQQQQLHRPSTREPSAAEDSFEFKKTLQTLRGRFPITEAHHTWATVCRNSGFSDDEIDKVINCYGSVVKTFEPNAKSPWLVVMVAVAKLKRRRETEQPASTTTYTINSVKSALTRALNFDDEAPAQLEPMAKCGDTQIEQAALRALALVRGTKAAAAETVFKATHPFGQLPVSQGSTAELDQARWANAKLVHCCDDELFEPDDLWGAGPCSQCDGEFVLLFENGEQDCATCSLAALYKHNKPLAQEYERQTAEPGGFGSEAGPDETRALAEEAARRSVPVDDVPAKDTTEVRTPLRGSHSGQTATNQHGKPSATAEQVTGDAQRAYQRLADAPWSDRYGEFDGQAVA